MTPPERLSSAVRLFWRFNAGACAGYALVCVIMNDNTGALVTVLAGLLFFYLSDLQHDDLDA